MESDNTRDQTLPSAKPAKAEIKLSKTFQRHAAALSTQFGMSVNELMDTYKDSQDSLSQVYNNMSTAKSDRTSWVGWSVFWGVIFWPVALYTGYQAYQSHEELSNIETMLKSDISKNQIKQAAVLPERQP
jgi:hypothetical protein